ncbi:MAG: hypothetical protein WCH34_05145 [Bacteroidota bacterium]
MKQLSLFSFIFVLLFISFNSFSQDWNIKVDKEGIKIFTRTISTSSVQEVRGEITVKSNLGGILALIDSVSEYTKWMSNCIYSERLKRTSKSSGYTYYAIKTPWPVTDRDACTYYKVLQDSLTKVVTITVKGVKDYLPEHASRVRIPSLDASWQLIPIAKGLTKIVYQVHCETGGIVPAIIVNAFITDTPYKNLASLRSIVESRLYPRIVIDYVKEL